MQGSLEGHCPTDCSVMMEGVSVPSGIAVTSYMWTLKPGQVANVPEGDISNFIDFIHLNLSSHMRQLAVCHHGRHGLGY